MARAGERRRAEVFINDRRALGVAAPHRPHAELARVFGEKRVFIALRGLESGSDWLHELQRQVQGAAVMLTLPPEGGAEVRDDEGRRRLDDPNDFVRFEIVTALKLGVDILPVALDTDVSPREADLPPALQPLLLRQATGFDTRRARRDAAQIAQAIKARLAERRKRRSSPVWIAAGAAAGFAAGVALGPTAWRAVGLSPPAPAALIEERAALRQSLAAAETSRNTALEARDRSAERAQALEAEVATLRAALSAAEARLADASSGSVALRAAQAEIANLKAQLATARAASVAAPRNLETFRDCADCPEMVVIPAGTFLIGLPLGEEGRTSNEFSRRTGEPQEVRVSRFALGKFEVTFAEWDACVRDGGCKDRPGHDGRRDGPVTDVSWYYAQDYIRWLNVQVGANLYRLPFEAEWEYAARAGTSTRYHWGDDYDSTRVADSGDIEPVGSRPANDFGIFDVAGSVWEWVANCWDDSLRGDRSNSPRTAEGTCENFILLGGSWKVRPGLHKNPERYRDPLNYRNVFVGFRVARTLNE